MAGTRPRQPTIYAVAAEAGVSIATVSRVLQGSSHTSERSRHRVLAATERLDYRPLAAARALAGRRYQAHGIVLGDLSGPYVAVTGWDDLMAARYVVPGLTTVAQPVHALGERASTLLQQRIEGVESVPGRAELASTVVLRGSCGCRP